MPFDVFFVGQKSMTCPFLEEVKETFYKVFFYLLFLFLLVLSKAEGTPSNENELKDIYCSQRCQVLYPWLHTVKPFFNYRTRYQWEKFSQEDTTNKGIHSLIAGISVKPQKNLELTIGLSTGGDNPRTVNTTFAPNWKKPEFRLDLASFVLNSNDYLKFVVGKFRMRDILWSPAHMLWDSDIMPIGGGGSIRGSFGEGVNTFIRAGYYTVREVKFTRSAPEVLFSQVAMKWGKSAYQSEATFSFYTVPNATHNVFKYSSNSNTKKANGKNRYQFNCLSPAMEFGTHITAEKKHRYLGTFIESIHNLNPNRQNNGFIVGLKLGQKNRPIKQGEWRIEYSYRYLERDAWMDTFPNHRFLRGRTNAKGHRPRLQLAVVDHVVLAGTYYNATSIVGKKLKEQIFQVDCSIIF